MAETGVGQGRRTGWKDSRVEADSEIDGKNEGQQSTELVSLSSMSPAVGRQ